MHRPVDLVLKNLPVEEKEEYADNWLSVNFADNQEGGKYNMCALRIEVATDSCAFPMSVRVTTVDNKKYEYVEQVAAIDIDIQGGCELNCLLRAFEQILEAKKVLDILNN